MNAVYYHIQKYTLEVGRATYRFLVNGEWSGALRSASDAPRSLRLRLHSLYDYGGKDRKHLSDARM